MSNYLYQGSGGTIGDLFLFSHCIYHLSLQHKISVAISKNLRTELKQLYIRHKFLDKIEELEDDVFCDVDKFKRFAVDKNYIAITYLHDFWFFKDVTFKHLNNWFDLQEKPNADFSNCIGIHIASSSNWDRPSIPFVKTWLRQIREANFKPYFLGTKKDEELLLQLYPEIKSWFTFEEEYWRFGKDSILQTIANISTVQGMLVFSSWSA